MSKARENDFAEVSVTGTTQYDLASLRRVIRTRWHATKRWWVDFQTREGLRGVDENILAEAGYRRTAAGSLAPLAARRGDRLY